MEGKHATLDVSGRDECLRMLKHHYDNFSSMRHVKGHGYAQKTFRDHAILRRYEDDRERLMSPDLSLEGMYKIVKEFHFFAWTACYGFD